MKIEIENWVDSFSGDLFSSKPHGKYTLYFFGGMWVEVTFSGNTLEVMDLFTGKHTYSYEIINSGNRIQLTDIITGETSSMSYQYSKEHDIVVLDDMEFRKDY